MTILRRACLAIWLAGATSCAAEPALPGWAAAQISGEDRLALFSLNRARPAGGEAALQELAGRVGLTHRGGPAVQGHEIRAFPVLNYSRNFNGGIPGDQMRIGGLTFTVNPTNRAKSGVVAGAGAVAAVGIAYAESSTLLLSAQGRAEALLGSGMHRQEAGLSACVQHHLSGWNWLDGCAALWRTKRSYDDPVTQRIYSLGPTRVFRAVGVDQQISARLHYLDRSDYKQGALSLGWTGAVPDFGAVAIEARAAQRAEGQNTVLRSLSVSLTRPVLGRIVTLGADYSTSGGSSVFGVARKDRVLTLSAAGDLTPRLRGHFSVSRSNSTIDIYDDLAAEWRLELTR